MSGNYDLVTPCYLELRGAVKERELLSGFPCNEMFCVFQNEAIIWKCRFVLADC